MKKLIIILIFSLAALTASFGQSWERFTTENSNLPVNSINNLVVDSNDNLWFHSKNAIFMYDQNQNIWHEFNETNSNLTAGFTHVEIGKDGSVYVSSTNIYRFNSKIIDFELIEKDINCLAFAVDKDGIIYLTTLINVLVKENNIWKIIFNGQENGLKYPSELIIDNNNVLWFGVQTNPDGVYSYHNKELKTFNNTNYDIPYFSTESLTIDSINNLWFISNLDIITYKYNTKNDSWTVFDSTNSILGKRNQSFSKSIQFNGKIWIASTNSAGFRPRRLISYDYNNWVEFNIDIALNLDSIPILDLKTLAIDSKNNVWIGTDKGLIKFNETTTSVETSEQKQIKIYPNPVGDLLTFDLEGKQAKSYTITDIFGRELIKENSLLSGSNNIDIHNLASGAYFIKFDFTNGETSSAKFVKE